MQSSTVDSTGVDGMAGGGADDGLLPDDGPVQSVPQGFAAQVTETVRTRGNAYGTPAENHQTTADLYSTWLSRRLGVHIVLSAEDVCALNIIQKVSRAAFCSKDDTWLDVAGYTENIAMIRPDQRNHRVTPKRLDLEGKTYSLPISKGHVVREVGEDAEMTVEKFDEQGIHCVWFAPNANTLSRRVFKVSEIVFVRNR